MQSGEKSPQTLSDNKNQNITKTKTKKKLRKNPIYNPLPLAFLKHGHISCTIRSSFKY